MPINEDIDLKELLMDLKVHINNIHGSQMAAKINGIFTLNMHQFQQLQIMMYGQINQLQQKRVFCG